MAAFELPSISFVATYVAAVVFGVSALFAAGIGEEPGWRGFALPRIQRYRPLRGSLLLGALWGVWHLPLWLWIPGHSGARSGLPAIGLLILSLALRLWLARSPAETIVRPSVGRHRQHAVTGA